MVDPAPAEVRRRSRFWLYTPFVLLLLVAIAWSIAWFFIRNRADEMLDAWLTAEAGQGRQWTCTERTIAGYPFRIELVCPTLTLKQGAVNASFGRVEAIAQVYQPRLVIAEIGGPLNVTDGRANVQGTWDLLQASIHATPNSFQRLSLAATNPKLTVSGLTPQAIATAGQRLEMHLRPNPNRVQDKAYDVALAIRQATIPFIDALIGGAEPTDLNADLTLTQADGFRGRPIAQELERWRAAGGTLDILMLSAAKGVRRMEAKGNLSIDAEHRPMGQLNASAAGLDGLLSNITGSRNTGALLGALLGQVPSAGRNNAQPQLSPLPPLRLENGLLALGPFVVPNVRLQPLY
jgi:hypothetical protein